ncbi:HAMP domain-containing sensor histidine kinase [Collinsella aerofaciens]|nr:ATP-binding protein [Collinsella aerofaciens]
MTALLTCAACVLTNCLVGYTGMRYMDAIGSGISALSAADVDTPQEFDPTKGSLDDEVTIVVNDAQESFGMTAWCITAGVTLLGGVLAYFVSGRALKPLRSFATQVERVQPDNLSEIRLSEDVPTELQQCSASFNDMIARLGEGFSSQRQFTGNAAHELRTPLALMQAQIELFISEHSGLQPETAELLDLLQEQTERMSRMTKVLLEMSELRSIPCEDDVELGPLSEEALTDLAPLAEKKGMALNCAGDALVIGSDTLLYRLVFNLVENAIRYSRPDSTVNVSICDNDSHVFLRVKDQGPGIPKQYRESIFQPFFRLDKSRSRAYGGAGLGLALVWEIAALHGGMVEVETSSENGTVMLVTLSKGSTT